MQNEYDAADYVRGYAGYFSTDDVTILLAYRKAYRGLVECRGMVSRTSTAHERRSLALAIKHFLKYLEHLRKILLPWSVERWRRAQEMAKFYFLHDGVSNRYAAV